MDGLRLYRCRSGLQVTALLALWAPCSAGEPASMPAEPEWVASGRPIKMADVPKMDYPYLAQWVDDHAHSPEDYVVGLFRKHDVVILGEMHNVREHKEFLIGLIPRLYQEAGVRCIGWEFSAHADNLRLEKLVTGKEFDREAALQFARDQSDHTWNSKEHWDVVEAVWRLNKSLPAGREPLRFVGLTCDMFKLHLEVQRLLSPESRVVRGSPEFDELINRHDATMAASVEKEILAKNQKGLVFVGRCHEFTHYQFRPHENLGRRIMGRILYEKYSDRVFPVWLESGYLPLFESVMALRGHKPAGFEVPSSPFANVLTPERFDASSTPLQNVARSIVYLAPRKKLHRNTAIKGFITEETFRKHREYYEADSGRKFTSVQEFDAYLQDFWPQP